MNAIRQLFSLALNRRLLGFIGVAGVLISSLLLSSCEGEIMVSGSVIDDSTKAPITDAFVNLSLQGYDYPSDTTGSDGRYVVWTYLVGMVWGPPRVTLEVRKSGYKTYERELGEYERSVIVELKRE